MRVNKCALIFDPLVKDNVKLQKLSKQLIQTVLEKTLKKQLVLLHPTQWSLGKSYRSIVPVQERLLRTLKGDGCSQWPSFTVSNQ